VDAIRRALTSALILAGAGAATYFLLLDDGARESLKDAILTTYDEVSAVTRKAMGIVDERLNAIPPDSAENRQRTREQWEAIGY
jgi:hypothetical protein